VAPPSSNASRPGRALAGLAALIVVLALAILGSDLASPGSWSKNFRVHLGLDLTSGTTVELRAVKPGGRPPTAADMQQAIQIMENRVNASGTTEAQVQQQGSDIINVSVPGQSAQQVVNLVSQTAELQFRQVLLAAPNSAAAAAPAPASPTPVPSVSPSAAPSASATPSASAQAAGGAGRSGGPILKFAPCCLTAEWNSVRENRARVWLNRLETRTIEASSALWRHLYRSQQPT
jgi:preprotein translocase subunit SecD